MMEPVTPRDPVEPFPLASLTAKSVGWITVLVPLRVLFELALLVARGYFVLRRRSRILTSGYVALVAGGFSLLILTLKDRRRSSAWQDIIREQSTP